MINKGNNHVNKIFTIKYKDLLIYFILLCYKFSLDVIYRFIISPNYSYQGFIYNFSISKYIISTFIYLFMLIPIIKLSRRRNNSSIIILLITLVYFVPGYSMYALSGQESNYFLYFTIYWFLILILQLIIPQIKSNLNRQNRNPIIFNLIVIAFAFFSLAISGVYTNFRINLSLSNIYDLRKEAREFNMPTILKYLQNASDKIIPLGLIYYIVSKKRIMAILLMTIQLLNFSFNGKKSILFTLVIIILITFFYQRKHISWITPSFLLLNCIALIESLFRGGQSQIVNYIIRRVMFMPTMIGYYYYDFFSRNELDYLRQSILRWFGATSPYSKISIQRLIGLLYFGSIETNANTGLVGDAYANFGWLGLFFYPIMIIIALRVLDYCTKQVDYRINMVLCVLIFYTFINGSFFTILLNNGFILTCITMFLCPQADVVEQNQDNGGKLNDIKNI